jgi:hypothetical protein
MHRSKEQQRDLQDYERDGPSYVHNILYILESNGPEEGSY